MLISKGKSDSTIANYSWSATLTTQKVYAVENITSKKETSRSSQLHRWWGLWRLLNRKLLLKAPGDTGFVGRKKRLRFGEV